MNSRGGEGDEAEFYRCLDEMVGNMIDKAIAEEGNNKICYYPSFDSLLRCD